MSWVYEGKRPRLSDPPTYDVAEICLNGHVTNPAVKNQPQHSKPYCDTCGKRTITKCEACNTDIQGRYNRGGSFYRPSFCKKCGKPFPWTEVKLQAAMALAGELNLTDDEKQIVKTSIDDIAQDNPRAELAVHRLVKYVDRKSGGAGSLLYKIGIDLASETVAKLFPK